MEEKTKRVRRPKEQIVAEKVEKLNESIKNWEDKIAAAKAKIEELTNPSKPTIKYKDITNKIKEYGLPLDKVMDQIDKMGKK